MTRGSRLAALAVGAGGAALALRALRRRPPGGQEPWTRTNHAGEPVTLLEGPAFVAGAVAGLAAAAVPAAASGAAMTAPLVAAAGAGAFGALDDLAGDSSSKGLRGHLTALARGEVTTGAVKIAGLAVTGLLAAVAADRAAPATAADTTLSAPVTGFAARGRSVRGTGRAGVFTGQAGRHRRGADRPGVLATLVGGAAIAGAANVANLLDLRPGRALKATTLVAAPLLLGGGPAASTAAAATGAALGSLPEDLAGRAMLGDTGANAAGALLGTAVVQRTGLRGRLVALAVVTALTVASEKVSFTKVIESTPGLRELDALGRR